MALVQSKRVKICWWKPSSRGLGTRPVFAQRKKSSAQKRRICLIFLVQTGNFGGGGDASEGTNGGPMDNVKDAVSAIRDSGSSWFCLAVLSGKVEAVLWVYRFVAQHYPGEVRAKIATVECCQASRNV